MSDDYDVYDVDSADYWLSEVGGAYCVGVCPPKYPGARYIPISDDDASDMAMSNVAGLWDDSEDELGAPWDVITKPLAKAVKSVGRAVKSVGKDIGKGAKTVGKGAAGLGKDTVFALNAVTRLPGKAVTATIGKVPFIGAPIAAAVKLSPAEALGGLTAKVAKGERLDKAFLSTAKGQLKAAKEVAPYVQTVMSFVPGVGTGVAAAIAAGTALAEGRTITDAVLKSARAAIPGGPAATAAFDAAVAVSKGKSLDKVALDAAVKQLPPASQKAVNTAIKLAKGKNVKEVVLQELRKSLPATAVKGLEIGTAMGVARTIQSQVISKAADPKVITEIAKQGNVALKKAAPAIKKATKGLDAKRLAGFQVAIGAVTKSGVNAHTLASIRSKLGNTQKAGFDYAVNTIVNKANPNWVTLVHGGKVTRGPWKGSKKGAKGAMRGRLVVGGKVKSGYFARV